MLAISNKTESTKEDKIEDKLKAEPFTKIRRRQNKRHLTHINLKYNVNNLTLCNITCFEKIQNIFNFLQEKRITVLLLLPGHVYRLWSWLAPIGISYFSSDIHKFLWWQRRQSIYPNFQQSNESWRVLQLFFRLQSWLVPIGILNFFSPWIRHPKSTNSYNYQT